MYTVSQKSSPLKLFVMAKYIFVKFYQFVASLRPHMLTSFGVFSLIFNKIAVIFLQVLIIYYSFELKSECLDFTTTGGRP